MFHQFIRLGKLLSPRDASDGKTKCSRAGTFAFLVLSPRDASDLCDRTRLDGPGGLGAHLSEMGCTIAGMRTVS
jgi:hypothetical protein